MSNAVFPALPGLTWNIVKRPLFATQVQTSVALVELRASFAAYPQWKWTITHQVLRTYASFTELQTLLNFFLARQGAFDSFLYDDLSDDSVTDQQFGIGNGSTTAFQLSRTLVASGFAEPIYNTNSTPVIKDNGVTKTAGADYNISATGLVTFTYTPIAGHTLTWTGTYYWRCRFDQDSLDFTEFANKFWEQRALSFLSVVGQ